MKEKGKWAKVALTSAHDLVQPVKVAQEAKRELRVRYVESKGGFPARIEIEMFVPKEG